MASLCQRQGRFFVWFGWFFYSSLVEETNISVAAPGTHRRTQQEMQAYPEIVPLEAVHCHSSSMLLTLAHFLLRLIFCNKNPCAESCSELEVRLQERSAGQEVPTIANSPCLNAGANACCNHALQKKLSHWKHFTVTYHASTLQWSSYIYFFNPGNMLFTSCFKALFFANNQGSQRQTVAIQGTWPFYYILQ